MKLPWYMKVISAEKTEKGFSIHIKVKRWWINLQIFKYLLIKNTFLIQIIVYFLWFLFFKDFSMIFSSFFLFCSGICLGIQIIKVSDLGWRAFF